MNIKIAALLTCHNRKEKTLASLSTLFRATLPYNYTLNVFLVDDGSTDGTSKIVKEKYPQINVIQGPGNLFWNKGMRLAWNTAAKTKEYDFFLWLNDDALLDKNALVELLSCQNEAKERDHVPAIIVGVCRINAHANEFSYGGRDDNGVIIPNGQLQTCQYINGNVVLVPQKIYKTVGILSPHYTHTMGDYDYGLQAIKTGFKCYTTRKYIAICPLNGLPEWCDPHTPFFKRIKLLYSPKGLNLKEYNTFRKKFWGWRWIIYAIKAYLQALSPSIYKRITKK